MQASLFCVFVIFFLHILVILSICTIFVPAKAQMAESVDALVSNTSGVTRAGSTPALGTRNGGHYALRFSFVPGWK